MASKVESICETLHFAAAAAAAAAYLSVSCCCRSGQGQEEHSDTLSSAVVAVGSIEVFEYRLAVADELSAQDLAYRNKKPFT